MKKLLIQHLIHDDNHHYNLSINPHKLSVVLLEGRDLKEGGVYLLLGLPKIILNKKRNAKEGDEQTEGLINFPK